MNSYQTYKVAVAIVRLLSGDDYLLRALPAMVQPYQEIAENTSALIAQTAADRTANLVQALRNKVAEARNEYKKLRPSAVFKSADTLLNELATLQAGNATVGKGVGRVMDALRRFHDCYEAFIEDYELPAAYELLIASRDLESAIQALTDVLNSVLITLRPISPVLREQGSIELYLDSPPSVEQVLRQLQALAALYTEVAGLLSVSASQHPLVIGNLNAGSLWTLLFGHSRVMGVLGSLIESSARFLYRNYTAEGRISAVPRKLEALNAVLQFADVLADAGVDTTEMKGHLQKSGVVVARELNELLAGTPRVVVNGEEISVQHGLEQRFLAESASLRLLSRGDNQARDGA